MSENLHDGYIVTEFNVEKSPRELQHIFMRCLYKTLATKVSPIPYIAISKSENSIDVEYVNGQAWFPEENRLEISILDINIASLFFDHFHILYEGITGIGKTYSSDALFYTVFGADGHYNLRLSGGLIADSVLRPFTSTSLDQGIPRTCIDHKKCAQYGAIFVDEINRGDTQEVLSLLDGGPIINGEKGHLRLPVPNTGEYKHIAIIAAMNPIDTIHTGATTLDGAVENRFLKFTFPNTVVETGAAQLEKRKNSTLHKEFWSLVKEETGLEGGWKELYPYITRPQLQEVNLTPQVKEFCDMALGYIGIYPEQTIKRNNSFLDYYTIEPCYEVNYESNQYKKIKEFHNYLQYPLVSRDLQKIYYTASLLSFIECYKQKKQEYEITIDHIAAGLGIILNGKLKPDNNGINMMDLVNDIKNEYNLFLKRFDIKNNYDGARIVAHQIALMDTPYNPESYILYIDAIINKFNQEASNPAEAVILSRFLSDMLIVKNFNERYGGHILKVTDTMEDPRDAFSFIYNTYKAQNNIYEQRLESFVPLSEKDE